VGKKVVLEHQTKKRVTLRLSLKVDVYSSCYRRSHGKVNGKKKSDGEGKEEAHKRWMKRSDHED
jgi:hypothetical protein